MLIARIIVSVLYALLMLFATVAQYRKSNKLDVLMLLGSLLLIAANFAGIITAIGSLLVIHASALQSGKRNGKINLPHHLVRLVVSLTIVALFWFS